MKNILKKTLFFAPLATAATLLPVIAVMQTKNDNMPKGSTDRIKAGTDDYRLPVISPFSYNEVDVNGKAPFKFASKSDADVVNKQTWDLVHEIIDQIQIGDDNYVVGSQTPLSTLWNNSVVALNYYKWATLFPQFEDRIYAKLSADNELQLFVFNGAFMVNNESTLPSDFYLPEGVVSIGSYAFYDNESSLIDFALPSTVKTINRYAFAGTQIATKFNLFDDHPSLATIGDFAFSYADIYGNLTYPAKTVVSPSAFTRTIWDYQLYIAGKDALGEYDPEALNKNWNNDDVDMSLQIWRKNFPVLANNVAFFISNNNGRSEIRSVGAFNIMQALPDNFYLPDGLANVASGMFTSTIGQHVNFSLPRTVNTIADNAFSGVVLDPMFDIENNKSLTTVGPMAFNGSTVYTGFGLPAQIGKNSILSVGMNVKMPKVGASTGHWIVDDSGSYSVKLVDDTQDQIVVDQLALWNARNPRQKGKIQLGYTDAAQTHLTLKVVPFAFSGAYLPSNFYLPDTVSEIGEGAFAGLKKTFNFAAPSNLETIGVNAFKGTCIESGFGWGVSSTTNKKVKSIGEGAFDGAGVYDGFTFPTSNEGISFGINADRVLKLTPLLDVKDIINKAFGVNQLGFRMEWFVDDSVSDDLNLRRLTAEQLIDAWKLNNQNLSQDGLKIINDNPKGGTYHSFVVPVGNQKIVTVGNIASQFSLNALEGYKIRPEQIRLFTYNFYAQANSQASWYNQYTGQNDTIVIEN